MHKVHFPIPYCAFSGLSNMLSLFPLPQQPDTLTAPTPPAWSPSNTTFYCSSLAPRNRNQGTFSTW